MDDGEKKKGNPDRKRERHAICTTAWLGSLVGELHCSSLMSVRANQRAACMQASQFLLPPHKHSPPANQTVMQLQLQPALSGLM
jgi:CBS-domain-containing membrane protein